VPRVLTPWHLPADARGTQTLEHGLANAG
jgi:hypothetical protein